MSQSVRRCTNNPGSLACPTEAALDVCFGILVAVRGAADVDHLLPLVMHDEAVVFLAALVGVPAVPGDYFEVEIKTSAGSVSTLFAWASLECL